MIRELLEYLNETQKPLPMARINELKMLEMMASPYNQSLISMIKEESDFYKSKKSDKRKQTKSQNKSDMKSGELMKHLKNVYDNPIKSNRNDSMSRGESDRSSGNEMPGLKKNKLVEIRNNKLKNNFAKNEFGVSSDEDYR